MDEKADRIFNCQTDIIKFNVGGKIFATTANTIRATPDTLFHKLIDSGKLDIKDEIFFDRSNKVFPIILDFLRTKTVSYKGLTKDEMALLKEDADYYQIDEIAKYLDGLLKEIEFVKSEDSGPYSYNGQTAGQGSAKDLKDKSCMKGICANSPGWINIELNNEWEFDTIEISGWRGNSSLWYSDNGAGAKILTSSDKKNWKNVGTIPYGYGNEIKTVTLTRSFGKYIRFEHTSYVGVGYLKIKKIEEKRAI